MDPLPGSHSTSSARRFAMVLPNFHPRVCGIGDFSVRFATELRRRGHDVALFSRTPVAPHPEAPELEVHGIEGRLPTTIARRAADAIEAFRPTDVLIQYTAQMWDAWRFGTPALVGLARRLRRAGAAVTLMGHELFIPFARRPDLILAASSQRLQFAALVKSCDRVFVTTGTRATSIAPLCRLLRVPAPGIVRVGANALPVPSRSEFQGKSGPRLGIFSTAAAGKRFDIVLKAFELVAREFPAAELVLIGDLGSPQRPLVRSIIDGVARHVMNDRIRMTGNLPLAGVANEIAKLDTYLFTMESGANTRSSTLPTALGSGVPTVAVHGNDTDDALFRDQHNIVFAPEMSGDAFGKAALRLLRDPALMAHVGQGARRLYEEHLRWDGIIDRFLEAT